MRCLPSLHSCLSLSLHSSLLLAPTWASHELSNWSCLLTLDIRLRWWLDDEGSSLCQSQHAASSSSDLTRHWTSEGVRLVRSLRSPLESLMSLTGPLMSLRGVSDSSPSRWQILAPCLADRVLGMCRPTMFSISATMGLKQDRELRKFGMELSGRWQPNQPVHCSIYCIDVQAGDIVDLQ